jgi:hypothetical protein
MNRTLEKDLWITLDLLYKGDSNVLDRINGDYIISNYFKIPDYAKDWNQSDKIKVVENLQKKIGSFIKLNSKMKEKVHILFIVIPCDKKDFIHKTANLHISKIIFVRHGGSITKKQNGQKKN